MTTAEWQQCDDAGAMLDYFWQQRAVAPGWRGLSTSGRLLDSHGEESNESYLTRRLHHYYLASCRRIWKLLPQENSRRSVELAEQFLAGAVPAVEVNNYEWHTEGAAFCIAYNTAPDDVSKWETEIRAMPPTELQSMLHPPKRAERVEPRELLKRAAYFADYAMIYPTIRPQGPPPEDYRLFLSAELLRQHVEFPGGLNRP